MKFPTFNWSFNQPRDGTLSPQMQESRMDVSRGETRVTPTPNSAQKKVLGLDLEEVEVWWCIVSLELTKMEEQ